MCSLLMPDTTGTEVWMADRSKKSGTAIQIDIL